MKAIWEYSLPSDEEAFNHALRGPATAGILEKLIAKLSRMAYPSEGATQYGALKILLQQLEQEMEEAGLHDKIQFPEAGGEH